MPTDVAASSWGAAPLVLVADDEPVVRDLVCDVLGESGYRTVTAAHGLEVVDLATRHALNGGMGAPAHRGHAETIFQSGAAGAAATLGSPAPAPGR